MSLSRKGVITTLAVATVILALATAFVIYHRVTPPRNLPEQVRTDEVLVRPDQQARVVEISEHDIQHAVVAGGTIAFDDQHVTHVFSPVTGRVTRLLARPGQRVQAGSPLLAIVSPDIGEAFSDVVKAQADLLAAEADYDRQEILMRNRAATDRDYQAAKDAYRQAKAEHQRALQKAALFKSGTLNTVTQEYVLRSPIDGEVIARSINPGVEVQGQYSGGASNELFTIGDIKDVWALADIQDLDLPHVKVGEEATLQVIAYPDQIFRGTIDWVAGSADPVLRTTRVRVALHNADEKLKPGMFATVSILQEAKREIAVPRDALVRVAETTFVFAFHEKRPDGTRVFKRRPVTASAEINGLVPISDGLSAGESVIVDGVVPRERPNDEAWISPEQLKAAAITVERVQARDIQRVVSIGGNLTFDDQRVSHIFSPVNGRVTRVLAEFGQHVDKGTPLLAIKSPDVGQWFADVVKAQAALVASQHEYQRQQDLFNAHATPERDLESAKSDWSKAKAELERAMQKTQLLKAGDVDQVTQEFILRSPIAGEVIDRNINPGTEIQGQYSGGSTIELFTIGDIKQLWVIGDVYEMDRPFVTEGDQLSVRVSSYPDERFDGVVDWVSDAVDPILRTSKIRCVIQNPKRLLRAEMYESIDIMLPSTKVLTVPRNAVMRIDGHAAVFVHTGDQRPDGREVFKLRPVVVSFDDNSPLLPILSGLEGDETIAVQHSLMLLGML